MGARRGRLTTPPRPNGRFRGNMTASEGTRGASLVRTGCSALRQLLGGHDAHGAALGKAATLYYQ